MTSPLVPLYLEALRRKHSGEKITGTSSLQLTQGRYLDLPEWSLSMMLKMISRSFLYLHSVSAKAGWAWFWNHIQATQMLVWVNLTNRISTIQFPFSQFNLSNVKKKNFMLEFSGMTLLCLALRNNQIKTITFRWQGKGERSPSHLLPSVIICGNMENLGKMV